MSSLSQVSIVYMLLIFFLFARICKNASFNKWSFLMYILEIARFLSYYCWLSRSHRYYYSFTCYIQFRPRNSRQITWPSATRLCRPHQTCTNRLSQICCQLQPSLTMSSTWEISPELFWECVLLRNHKWRTREFW